MVVANPPYVGPLAKYGDLLNVGDVSEVLGVSERTIYRLVNNDELPSVKVGHRLYFPRVALVEMLGLGVRNEYQRH